MVAKAQLSLHLEAPPSPRKVAEVAETEVCALMALLIEQVVVAEQSAPGEEALDERQS